MRRRGTLAACAALALAAAACGQAAGGQPPGQLGSKETCDRVVATTGGTVIAAGQGPASAVREWWADWSRYHQVPLKDDTKLAKTPAGDRVTVCTLLDFARIIPESGEEPTPRPYNGWAFVTDDGRWDFGFWFGDEPAGYPDKAPPGLWEAPVPPAGAPQGAQS